eukprot:CAMPEP_0113690912 /NCGR_PEP_ID=MMETSP0038_2-20120614/18091_1 /TAXON_ID=2898 /ORGANISM="Cryptomonas paramecium" /LENGTH=260 /DNA_ID=CAMNT_0000612363 /DNA_START=65 /DNA_END=844 /DNA_ORIENTATION=- /assembly_acc=CAM_ASM_000170
MDWLQKAGDLLDKLDRTAAEKLAGSEHDGEIDEALDETEDTETDTAVGTSDLPLSGLQGDLNNGALKALKSEQIRYQREIKGLKEEIKQLNAKLTHKEKLVADTNQLYKDLMRKSSEDLKRLEAEIALKEESRRRHEEREREAVAEQENLRRQLKSQAALLEEHSSKAPELAATKQELARLQLEHAHITQVYEALEKEVQSARDLHRTDQLHFQDREESLSGETLQLMRQLAHAQQELSDKAAEVRALEARAAAATSAVS